MWDIATQFFGHNWKKTKVSMKDTMEEDKGQSKEQQDEVSSFVSDCTSYSKISQTTSVKDLCTDNFKKDEALHQT